MLKDHLTSLIPNFPIKMKEINQVSNLSEVIYWLKITVRIKSGFLDFLSIYIIWFTLKEHT